jgi:hypothetical protein
MATHSVMDQSGHKTFDFDPADSAALSEAQERFNQLLEQGYSAFEKIGEGQSSRLKQFKVAPDVLFIPHLAGG